MFQVCLPLYQNGKMKDCFNCVFFFSCSCAGGWFPIRYDASYGSVNKKPQPERLRLYFHYALADITWAR